MDSVNVVLSRDGQRCTSALGRKRPVGFVISRQFERPLWRKADINSGTPEIGSKCVRFPRENRHSANIAEKVC